MNVNDHSQEAPTKESLYDKIPLTLKQLDIIIVTGVIAFFAVFTLGALVGNGILHF